MVKKATWCFLTNSINMPLRKLSKKFLVLFLQVFRDIKLFCIPSIFFQAILWAGKKNFKNRPGSKEFPISDNFDTPRWFPLSTSSLSLLLLLPQDTRVVIIIIRRRRKRRRGAKIFLSSLLVSPPLPTQPMLWEEGGKDDFSFGTKSKGKQDLSKSRPEGTDTWLCWVKKTVNFFLLIIVCAIEAWKMFYVQKGQKKTTERGVAHFLGKGGEREAKNTAQWTHEAFPQERGKENRICRYSVPEKKGKRRRGLFLTPVLLLLLLHLRSQSRRRRQRRSVTAVLSKSRAYNATFCFLFCAKSGPG